MKTIGIIGGMGPAATSDLFRKIILNTKAKRDQEHIHVIIDSNTAISDRTEFILNHGKSPLPEMMRSALLLEKAGADFLLMPCNTAHYFYREISQAIRIPLIDMLKETANYVRRNYAGKKVGLLATDGTIQTGLYDSYLNQADVKFLKPKETQASVMEFIYNVIKGGNYSLGADRLISAVDELKKMGAEAFILGCTELSAAQGLYKIEEDFVDPLDIIARYAIEYAGGEVHRETEKD